MNNVNLILFGKERTLFKDSRNYKIVLSDFRKALPLKNYLKYIGILPCFFLWGCGSSPDADHSSLLFKSDPELNPDVNGRPSPLDIHIYQLTDSKKFMQANFFDLYNDAQSSLGEDLLEKRRLEIKPNQEAKVNLPDNLKSKYLGFIFAYQDLEGAKWRYIIDQPRNSGLCITLKNKGFQVNSSGNEQLADQSPSENNKGNK